MIINPTTLSVESTINMIVAELGDPTSNKLGSKIYETELGKVLVERVKHTEPFSPCHVWKFGSETEPDTDAVIANRHDTSIKYYLQFSIHESMSKFLITAMIEMAFGEIAYKSITGEHYGFSDYRQAFILQAIGEYYQRQRLIDDVTTYINYFVNDHGPFARKNRYRDEVARMLVKSLERDAMRILTEALDAAEGKPYDSTSLSDFWKAVLMFCCKGSYKDRHKGKNMRRTIRKLEEVTKDQSLTGFEFVDWLYNKDIPEPAPEEDYGKAGKISMDIVDKEH